MIDIFELLNKLGINITENSSPIFLFACSILILSLISLVCFIQIMLYFLINYYSENEKFINKISKLPILLKIVKFYKISNIVSIMIEIGFFLLSMTSIIYLCFKVVYV